MSLVHCCLAKSGQNIIGKRKMYRYKKAFVRPTLSTTHKILWGKKAKILCVRIPLQKNSVICLGKKKSTLVGHLKWGAYIKDCHGTAYSRRYDQEDVTAQHGHIL